MTENCPLCKDETTKLRKLFVEHVISSEENVNAYMSGKLTFESWKKEIEQAVKEE